jgi:hypothetical protein
MLTMTANLFLYVLRKYEEDNIPLKQASINAVLWQLQNYKQAVAAIVI